MAKTMFEKMGGNFGGLQNETVHLQRAKRSLV